MQHAAQCPFCSMRMEMHSLGRFSVIFQRQAVLCCWQNMFCVFQDQCQPVSVVLVRGNDFLCFIIEENSVLTNSLSVCIIHFYIFNFFLFDIVIF